MFRVTINGKSHNFSHQISVLEAFSRIGIEVPSLCNDDRLKPAGACRTCIVEIEGMKHPVTACNNVILDGMVIHTHSAKIEELRGTLLQLLARDYPKDAVLREPAHDFHRWLNVYGIEPSNTQSEKINPDSSNPYIQVDMSRCIDCFRCVRICEEVQGQFVWQVWGRGDRIKILPDSENLLGDSTCTSCGACADACPSGAIQDKSLIQHGLPSKWTRTICAYCGVGCEMLVGTKENKIINIRPAQDALVNKGHLCSKGRYAFSYVHSSDRVQKPLIRENGKWREASWSTAFDHVAERLGFIKEQYGAETIGVLGSSRATNEENYLIQKFARLALQTNNVDCCARVCHTPSAAALKIMLGSGGATNSLDDIEKAQTLMICGTNTTENHPVTGARVKQAVLNGANLIVIDPRKIELSQYASVHLALRPGTNIPLFNAMAHCILEEGYFDETFIKERVLDFEEFHKFIADFSPEKAAVICGVDSADIRRAARLYAMKKPSMILNGLGLTEFTQGTETVMSLINLALITGNLGRSGSGINPMRGQNNVQGAAIMGCEPNDLAGGISIKNGKALCEQVWQASIPSAHGMNLLQMMDAAAQEKLKALYVVGYDVLLSNPNMAQSRISFKNLDFVIVQDLFLNQTAEEFGHVFLPICSSFEKTGTFMNGERRIQMIRKAIEPLEGTKADWEVICELAAKMAKGNFFNYKGPQDIWDEIREVWPAVRGISYDRLERGGIQWPCPTIDHPGTEILHIEKFASSKKAKLRNINFVPSAEQINAEYPFLLITGRNLYQFNAATMSGRTANITLRATDTLDINPIDAQAMRLSSGDRVIIKSRYGEAILPIRISEQVKPSELFCTFSTPLFMVNQLTGPHRDKYVDTPEYKMTAVRLEHVDKNKNVPGQ